MRITIFFALLVLVTAAVAQGKNPIQDMVLLSENLRTCTPYSYDFIHRETGDVLQRTIRGEVEGKCLYVEGMPDNAVMTCRYSMEVREAVAEYYEQLALSRANVKTNVELAVSADAVDGEEGETPLDTALKDGTCTVQGDQ